MKERKCSKCFEVKPLNQFVDQKCYRVTGAVYYRKHSHCRTCHVKQADAWNRAHPDRFRASVARWVKNHPEKVREMHLKKYHRRMKNPAYREKLRIRSRERYHRNKSAKA